MGKYIITNSIVDMISVTNFEMHKKVGEHGYAIIKGIIASSDEKKVIRAAVTNEFASIYTQEEGKDKSLFSGVILCVDVSNESGVKVATIKLGGGTMLLATDIRTRTFQDSSMTFDELISTVNSSYGCISVGQNTAIGVNLGRLIVQYKEDDWTFLKRLASIHNQPVIPHFSKESIYYDFGLNTDVNEYGVNALSYSKGNNKSEYKEKFENKVPEISPDDFNYVVVTTRDFYSLGDKIKFEGENMYIYQADSIFDGAEIIHTYELRKKKGFMVETLYNWGLTGASLNASIISTSNDTVKVVVDADGMQDESKAKRFPYSTVYSSPDGTGWYCMPEKGDSVRLYFPDEIENNGYIISSIHTGNSGGSGGKDSSDAPRSNPDNKSISNKYNKKIELTPTTIVMTNNKGMSITLDDEVGISIVSDKKISIKSDDEIDILSANAAINVNAKEQIVLSQSSSKITMKDSITIEGSKVYMQ